MLSTCPRLQIRRPSPTTAEFTVTTLRPLPTPLHVVLLVARLLVSLATVLILHARYALSPLAERTPLLRAPAYFRSPAGRTVACLADRIPVPVLVPAAVALLWLLSRRGYACESLLVMRGLGVQTSESPASYLANTATRFIPTEKIRDILVNEAFRGFEVRYYLVVVVEGEEDVVVVFPGLLPRLKIVEEVWRGARGCLYEGRGEEKGLIS
ncbi:GPI-GlcNAc transferase complex, PIG-H component-domain-containing protein [Ilyonectria destructans]|nr:GPI-GlcNAc transferase complex, PIG-H component-domain-containing protein [Ilyonectria destructans]